MAVSKNRRKNDTAAKKRAREKAKIEKRKQLRIEREKEMQKILEEGPKYFHEVKDNVNQLIEGTEKIIEVYQSQEWSEESPLTEEERANFDNIVSNNKALLDEARRNVDSTVIEQKELEDKIVKGEVDPIDANMEIINNTFAIKEHIEYIAMEGIGEIQSAFAQKCPNQLVPSFVTDADGNVADEALIAVDGTVISMSTMAPEQGVIVEAEATEVAEEEKETK